MAGFLCILGKESLASVFHFPSGSSLLTWNDKHPWFPRVKKKALSFGNLSGNRDSITFQLPIESLIP